MKLIGFIGTEKYDIMHYLSRVLKRLGKEVLMIDASKRKALTASVPTSHAVLFDYNGVDFAANLECLREHASLSDYDYVLIDFGFQRTNKLVDKCNEIWFVTDEQKHNLMHIRSVKLQATQPRFAIMRSISSKRQLSYYLQLLQGVGITRSTVFVLPDTTQNRKAMLNCMYRDLISLKEITNEMADVLAQIIANDFSEKEIYNAIRALRRG